MFFPLLFPPPSFALSLPTLRSALRVHDLIPLSQDLHRCANQLQHRLRRVDENRERTSKDQDISPKCCLLCLIASDASLVPLLSFPQSSLLPLPSTFPTIAPSKPLFYLDLGELLCHILDISRWGACTHARSGIIHGRR